MWRRPLTVISALALLALPVVAAGCGGSSKAAASVSTATTTTTGSRSAANVKFTACMQAQGVQVPNFGARRQGTPPAGAQGQPGQTPNGQRRGGFFSDPKSRAAFTKCRQLLPGGGSFGGRRAGANGQAFAKYRQCLAAHGIKLSGGGPFGGANVASPAFQKAAKACRALVPSFQRQGGVGGAPAATVPTP